MIEKEVLEILKRVGALLTDGHFVYTSGRHGSAYVNKDALYPHTREISRVCRAIAEAFVSERVEAVLGPVTGGVILSQWVAYHLSEMARREIYAVYAEKGDDGFSFVIGRGYRKFIEGRRVLVVDDILTTGGSVKRVVDVARSVGGEVIGVVALCNRGGVTAEELGQVPRIVSLSNIPLDSWEEGDCPLCEKKVSINTEVGKGREFLARRT